MFFLNPSKIGVINLAIFWPPACSIGSMVIVTWLGQQLNQETQLGWPPCMKPWWSNHHSHL